MGADKVDRWLGFALMLFTMVLYWVFRSQEQSGDSLAYAFAIETGEALFHPHHILFAPIVRVLYLLSTGLHASFDAVAVAQVHNIAWAGIAAVSMYVTVRIVLDSRRWALFTALALVACNGMFIRATEAEVYVPAAGCVALVTLILATAYKKGWSVGRLILLSFFFALSVLFHQSNLFFVVPLGVALFSGGPLRSARRIGIVMGMSGLLVLGTYVLCYAGTGKPANATEFLRFCLNYTQHPNPGWGTFAHFDVAGVALLLKSQLRNIVWLPPGRSSLVATGIGLFGVVLLGLLVYGSRRFPYRHDYRLLRIFLIAWLVVHSVFFLWWLPGEDEFFVISLIPILLLASISLHGLLRCKAPSLMKKVLPALVAAIFLPVFAINGYNSILPRAASKGASYERASRIAAVASDDCTVVTSYPELQNLRYYFGRQNGLETSLLLLYAYHRGVIPDEYRPDAQRPVLVSLGSLVPEYRGVGVSGYEDRFGWLVFFEILFDARDGNGLDAKRVRAFEVVTDSEGTAYVLLSAEGITVADMNQLFEELDRRIRLTTHTAFASFVRWANR